MRPLLATWAQRDLMSNLEIKRTRLWPRPKVSRLYAGVKRLGGSSVLPAAAISCRLAPFGKSLLEAPPWISPSRYLRFAAPLVLLGFAPAYSLCHLFRLQRDFASYDITDLATSNRFRTKSPVSQPGSLSFKHRGHRYQRHCSSPSLGT